MAAIPKDPFMLLSYVNTQLRDFYGSPQALCSALELDWGELEKRLEGIDYHYSPERNQFV